MLRLAHKHPLLKDPVWLLAILGLFLFSACSSADQSAMDKLNALSYSYHYRSLDSTAVYARRVLDAASPADASQRAEALNHLAFVAMARMHYGKADSLLQQVSATTDNQLELLVSYIQNMRLCQRRSDNRAFYEYREKAVQAQKRIDEERSMLSDHQRQRLCYAESEMAIVTSTYYYYVGLETQSVEAMQQLNIDEVRHDTAQYLNYLYNAGAGGIVTEGSADDIRQEEMGLLRRCLTIAERGGYVYFVAQAKEALAEHLFSAPSAIPDDQLLAIALADEALQLFDSYGDVYQIAGAYRTLASCYHAMGEEEKAAQYLDWSLSDERIRQAPDLIASIYEQLSVVYAAVDDKVNSDYYRNHYLDLQEQTRQDRELEARAGLLDAAVRQLNWMMLAVLGAIVLLVFLLLLFSRQNRKRQVNSELDELLEEKNEQMNEARLRVEKNERRLLEQRAKVSLAVSILPLIDRILHETKCLEHQPTLDASDNQERLDYIRELTDNINEQNHLLTEWIQLRQGELNLHIESFPLQPLFDLVSRSSHGFSMKGVTLDVRATDATVKADRVLTLFMLNTLADNARKFTAEGDSVTISAEESADYVEVSVSDTGCGMTDEQLQHVFDNKPVHDDGHEKTKSGVQRSHGFGLMNCKGIIEKYRKVSQIFSVCLLSAESEQGRGSRFFFRLPKGVLRCLVLGVGCWLFRCLVLGVGCWLYASTVCASTTTHHPSPTTHDPSPTTHHPSPTTHHPLSQAHIYADSAFFSNINGTYRRTLLFADSCRQCLNAHYQQQHPKGRLLMTRDAENSSLPAEIQWLHQGLETNYQIILDIRNESAVAALALHEWSLYTYNNKVYTQLFKELSADNTLADYCRAMQQSHINKRIAVILLLVLLVMIVPAYYMLYYRHRLYDRFRRERLQETNIEMTDDELRRAELENANLHVANNVLDNCLSTLKHETMYYPSRIRQLVDAGDIHSLEEVTSYYRDLYAILIRQATDQVERIPLHVRPVELYGRQVLGDENLLRYLFELLETSSEMTSEVKDDNYVVFHIPLTSHPSPIPWGGVGGGLPLAFYLSRQIVRDHGEATNRRACGITISEHQIDITLPRYHGSV